MAEAVVEVITGRERRRRWTVDEKLRIVAETFEPGASVGQVAVRHDVYPGLLFTWRRQVRNGNLSSPRAPLFLPVATEAPDASSSSSRRGAERSEGRAPRRIEIEFTDGSRVRVDDGVSMTTLRRVLAALRG